MKNNQFEDQKTDDLKVIWKDICNEYLRRFCAKHDFTYDPDMWVGGDPGTIIEVCDMWTNIHDIRYDVDNHIHPDVFSAWYWKSLELHELGVEHWMNYESYCKGAPDEFDEARMERLREAKKRVQEAEVAFKKEIEDAKSGSVSGRPLF